MYDKLRAQLAESTITDLTKSIEFYKTQHGEYPNSLEVLRDSLSEDALVYIYDPTDVKVDGKEPRLFYYEVIDDDHYYLLGVGADLQPFTSDDIHPNVALGPNSEMGLIVKNLNKS